MFSNQGNQGNQRNQQGFARSFSAFPAPDPTQNSEGSSNNNPRLRKNVNPQQQQQQQAFGQDPSRRGGRTTARRGTKYKGAGRGASSLNPTLNRGKNATINRAFDEAFSDAPSPSQQQQQQQQIRRKPRMEKKMTNAADFASPLDNAIASMESAKQTGVSQKHGFANKPTRFNPRASPFVSQKAQHQQQQVSSSPFASQKGKGVVSSPFANQQQQQQSVPVFGNSTFMNQNQSSHDAFKSPFLRNNALDKPSHVFAQHSNAPPQASPFYSTQANNASAFGAPSTSSTPFFNNQPQQQQSSFGMFSDSKPSSEPPTYMETSSAEPSPFDEHPPQLSNTPFVMNQSSSTGRAPSHMQQRTINPKRTMGNAAFDNEDIPFSELVQKKKEATAFAKPSQQQQHQKQNKRFASGQGKKSQQATAFGQSSMNKETLPSAITSPFVSKTPNKESNMMTSSTFAKPSLSKMAASSMKEKKSMGGLNQQPLQSQQQQKTGLMAHAIKNKAVDRATRFGSTEKTIIYDKMKQMRLIERQKAIEDGLIPDPDAPTTLDQAIDFRGSCETMCPEFEIVEREIQNNIDPMELNESGAVDMQKMVKAYRRSAAGNEQPLPCDVRSTPALTRTLNYLIDDVLTNNSLENCHGFIRDRTRSIRQDFTRQNIGDVAAVEVFERIARFHILCLHEMCELDEAKFSHQQEMEQLRKVLISLIEFYDDLRLEGIETENEAEFRAYHIIVHFRDQDVVRQTMTLPLSIFKHPYIDLALKFHSFAQRSNEIMETPSRRNKPINVPASQNFYTQFFKWVSNPETPFLMACLLESHFSDVRKGALKAMNVSYVYKLAGVPAKDIQRILCYDSLRQLLEEVKLYGLVVDTSLKEPTIRFGQKHYQNKQPVFVEPLTNPSQKRSMMLVEPKKIGRSFKDIINNSSTITNLQEAQASLPAHQKEPFAAKPTPKVIIKDTRQEKFEAAKAAADAAEAAVALEKQKIEALMKEKKHQQEQAALREAERLKEMQRAEMARQAEAAAAAAKAEEQKKERARLEALRIEEEHRRRKENQIKLEALRRRELDEQRLRKKRVIDKDRIARGIYLELMSECVNEKAKERVTVAYVKQKRAMNFVKGKVQRWLSVSRARIQKQNKEILTRKKMWIFSKTIAQNNPEPGSKYPCLSRLPLSFTDDVMKHRADYALSAESCSVEFNRFENQKEMEMAIWKYEELNRLMFARLSELKAPIKDEFDHVWTNLIYCDPTAKHAQNWFAHKFGFDHKSNRKITSHNGFDVVNKLITSTKELYPQLTYSIRAITMVLPEKRTVNEVHNEAFWRTQKGRLDTLITSIKDVYPNIQVPLLITYFPDDVSNTEGILLEMPKLLGFYNEMFVTDYHILIMDPKTITTRIIDTMVWLAEASVA